jgi:hypothetical protein
LLAACLQIAHCSDLFYFSCVISALAAYQMVRRFYVCECGILSFLMTKLEMSFIERRNMFNINFSSAIVVIIAGRKTEVLCFFSALLHLKSLDLPVFKILFIANIFV